MTKPQEGKMTQKGELARQRILETAFQLFSTKGYEETTMRDIAAEAGYSPGLTYRYFASKEELVMLVYENMAEDLDSYVRSLAPAPLTERFHSTVAKQLELMVPYRDMLAALFGTALNPRSKVGVFSDNVAHVRRKARGSYL